MAGNYEEKTRDEILMKFVSFSLFDFEVSLTTFVLAYVNFTRKNEYSLVETCENEMECRSARKEDKRNLDRESPLFNSGVKKKKKN